MIIVSQDKTEIVNFDNITRIYVHKCPNEISDVRCDTVNDLVINLGNYDTEERAKEVLQEIIEFYEISKRHECSSNNGMTLFIKITFVYETPKE